MRFLTTIILLLALPVFAVNYYVANTSLGSGDGSSAVNAEAFASFNQSTIVAGDTVHLVGAINHGFGLASNNSGSGTPANPVTIYFEPGASLSLTNGELFYMVGLSNYVIDGGVNGFLENTATGTGMTYTNIAKFIQADRCVNLTIKNLGFRNQYVHLWSDNYPDIAAAGAIYANGLYGTNVFSDCTFSNCGWAINLPNSAPSWLVCSNDTFVNCDHGIVPVGTNEVITACHFGAMKVWDASGGGYHHDAIHFDAAGNPLWTLVVSRCLFDGDSGSNVTSEIYFETGPAVSTVENCIFALSNTNFNGTGCITGGAHFYNNTFIGSSAHNSIAINTANPDLRNNIFENFATYITLTGFTNFVALGNNIYAQQAPGGNYPFTVNATNYSTFSAFTSAWSDTGSIYTNGVVANSDGTVFTGSPAIGAGANLSSIFTTDYAGAARPSTGAWDIGAYIYSSGGGGVISTPEFLRLLNK